MKYLRFFAVLLSIVLVSFSANAQEQERILNYSVVVNVNEDASMDVYEHIKVLALGKDIKLGIYREIPKNYYIDGRKIKTSINVISVERDGQPENFWVENHSSNKKIQIGAKEDTIYNRLKPGIYEYTIHWRTKGHVRGFENYDEIYFNAIGTNWQFQIDNAQAKIILPEGVKIIQSAGYIGYDRSTELAFIEEEGPYETNFYASRVLQPKEGLTMAVGFEKGLLEIANKSNILTKLIGKIMDVGHPYITYESAILILVTIMLLAYYLVVWYLYGRDDAIKTVTPQFEPPKDVSFLDSAVIWKGRSLNLEKAFYSSLISLASKGNMEIDMKKEEVRKLEGGTTLYEYERNILKNLFKKTSVSIKKYSRAVYDSFTGFVADVKKTRTKHIKENKIFILIGVLVYISLMMIMPDTEVILARVLISLGITVFYMPFFFISFALIKSKNIVGYFVGTFVTLHYLVFFFAMPMAIAGSTSKFDIVFSLIILLSCVIHYVFYVLMDKPLPKAVEILTHLKGLYMYMSATDKEIYMRVTPAIFEKNLPYAILFGIEEEWFKKLKSLYPTYSPEWFKSDKAFEYASILAIHRNLSKARVDTSKSSYSGGRSGFGSSSGSGGGGSSGGGSGGGGGGGR